MKAAYKLTIDAKSCTGLLFIANDKAGIKNNRLSAAAEREAANGYIMTEARSGGFCRFDITTILGDMMTDKNAVFDFIKATVDKPERFVYVQSCLEEYFAAGDYSVQRISQLMGKHGASFGETGETGLTVYHCSDLQQVAFSILHFLILGGFKFASCKHCGRLYATKTLKTVYCNRKSLYSGYERYTCKDAVKHIIDSLNKRCRVIDERLRQKEKAWAMSEDEDGKLEIDRTHKYYKARLSFGIKCADYKAKVKEAPTVENLQEFSRFLYSGEGLPKRYERIKETMR